MSNEERLKTVGQKLILLARLRYGNKVDPLDQADYLAREVGINTPMAISAICAAMND